MAFGLGIIRLYDLKDVQQKNLSGAAGKILQDWTKNLELLLFSSILGGHSE